MPTGGGSPVPTITPPRDEADFPRFLAQVEAHPDYREVLRRLEAYGETEEEVMTWSVRHHAPRGRWTLTRSRLHRRIILGALGAGTKARRGRPAHAVLLMGAPASGKTSVAVPMASRFRVKFVNVNADLYKERLPEYEGWNAAALHEESALLAERDIYPRAVESRRHLLLDMTGTNGDKMVDYAADLTLEGYYVHAVAVALPAWKAAGRAWARFQKNPFGRYGRRDPTLEPGRFVPLKYVYEGVNGKPAETYKRLKSHPAMVSWQCWSTDVPPGQPPVLIEKGHR